MPAAPAGPGSTAVDYCDQSVARILRDRQRHLVAPSRKHGVVAVHGAPGHLGRGSRRPLLGNDAAVRRAEPGIVYPDGAQSRVPGYALRRGVIAARWATSRAACTTLGFRRPRSATDPPATPTAQPDQSTPRSRSCVQRSSSLTTSPPNAGSATGSAVTSPTWQGTMTFAFPATDEGGGVYQAVLEVDGAPVLARTIDDWGGRCVDTTPGQRVFRYPRPCLTSVDAARAGGRQCAARGRPRRRSARLGRRRQRADGLCGAQDDRGAGAHHRTGQRARRARRRERRQRGGRGAPGRALGAHAGDRR